MLWVLLVNETKLTVRVLTRPGDPLGAPFEAVARALAGSGIRAHVEQRDESETIIHNARDVYPLATPAAVDAAFRSILEGCK